MWFRPAATVVTAPNPTDDMAVQCSSSGMTRRILFRQGVAGMLQLPIAPPTGVAAEPLLLLLRRERPPATGAVEIGTDARLEAGLWCAWHIAEGIVRDGRRQALLTRGLTHCSRLR